MCRGDMLRKMNMGIGVLSHSEGSQLVVRLYRLTVVLVWFRLGARKKRSGA